MNEDLLILDVERRPRTPERDAVRARARRGEYRVPGCHAPRNTLVDDLLNANLPDLAEAAAQGRYDRPQTWSAHAAYQRARSTAKRWTET